MKNIYKEGVVRVTSRGVGYVELPKQEEKIEIARENLNTALHEDRVLIDPREKKVIKIILRAKKEFVGTLEKDAHGYYLAPQDFHVYVHIHIPHKNLKDAKRGYKVLAKITDWKDPRKEPSGEIIEIIGEKGLHETEMRAIALDKGIIFSFPPDVEKEASDIKRRAKDLLQTEAKKRRDFREIPTFTIDPADAKDFDDALSLRKLPNNNFEIGVHIADPSFYIREGSPIDTEAARRTTSVYLVDRTIPMLPEVLSNDLCSLNQGEDKLTFSFVCEITENGEIKKRWFGKTLINSKKRFTYEDAEKVLTKAQGPFCKELSSLKNIAEKLRAKRFEAGALAFNQPEVQFDLDSRGRPIRVYKKEHLPTHDLIEEWMLLANSEVAEFASTHDKNIETMFIYRVHPLPTEDKVKELVHLMKALGYSLPSKKIPTTNKEIGELIQSAEGSARENIVHLATIRAMERAIYSTKDTGHFGLSIKHYTHFTSPIRRYPDIIVHRLMALYLRGKKPPKEKLAHYEALSRYASHMERIAQEAEWASIKYKQTEYMAEHIGKVYDGSVTGINERGMFVREKETLAEGMIRFRDMKDDYYIYDEKNACAIGQKKKKKYRLGDTLKIKVLRADVEKRFIDYGIIR